MNFVNVNRFFNSCYNIGVFFVFEGASVQNATYMFPVRIIVLHVDTGSTLPQSGVSLRPLNACHLASRVIL